MDKKIDTVREALVEKVITFFNNRLTIGETEDECGDLVSVIELDKDFRPDLAKILFAIGPGAISPSKNTEKLCHQIYDVLPISPALKLLDDGKLYTLMVAHDEAIRREALQSVRKEIEEWRDDITCWDYDEGYLDGTENALKIIDAAILSVEPAQGDGEAEVNDDLETVAQVIRYHASAGGEYEYRGKIAMEAFVRIKRRIEEAKE